MDTDKKGEISPSSAFQTESKNLKEAQKMPESERMSFISHDIANLIESPLIALPCAFSEIPELDSAVNKAIESFDNLNSLEGLNPKSIEAFLNDFNKIPVPEIPKTKRLTQDEKELFIYRMVDKIPILKRVMPSLCYSMHFLATGDLESLAKLKAEKIALSAGKFNDRFPNNKDPIRVTFGHGKLSVYNKSTVPLPDNAFELGKKGTGEGSNNGFGLFTARIYAGIFGKQISGECKPLPNENKGYEIKFTAEIS